MNSEIMKKKRKKAEFNENQEQLNDLKERAEATISFLPSQILPTEERIEIKNEIQQANNLEDFSKIRAKLYEAIKREKGEQTARK